MRNALLLAAAILLLLWIDQRSTGPEIHHGPDGDWYESPWGRAWVVPHFDTPYESQP